MRKETLYCGHPKNQENTYTWHDKTFCRKCRSEYARKRYQKKKYMGKDDNPEMFQIYLSVLDVLNLVIEGLKEKRNMLPLLNDLRNQLELKEQLTNAKHSKG